MLPRDPDESAVQLKVRLDQRYSAELGVVISDSVGRAWRNGVVGLALGCSGLKPLTDLRGQPDRDGRPLNVTLVGVADQIAAAAALLMGEAAEGQPVVLIRGLEWEPSLQNAAALIRPTEQDMFR